MTTPVPPRWDVVIAGGGAAGLSLAAHLAAGAWRDRAVLVVDDAAQDPETLAWASWSARPRLLDGAVVRGWDQARVAADGWSAILPLAPYRYQLVTGTSLAAAVRPLLAAAPGFARLTGRVESIEDGTRAARVTVDGTVVEARYVLDSVLGPPQPAGGPVLAFTGREVRAQEPVFDERVATLIDLRVPQVGGVCFCYLLPMTSTRALVELARFAAAGVTSSEDEATLVRYAQRSLDGARSTVLRREGGVLSLTPPGPRRAGARILAIGRPGGLLKPTTGYAYDRMQRDAVAVAASLGRVGHPFALPRARWRHRALDAVLLGLLATEPERVADTFVRLFRDLPTPLVLRFLDEDTTLAEEARIVSVLPPVPFLHAALRTVVSRGR